MAITPSSKIWLSGSRGFIGSHLRKTLQMVYGCDPVCLISSPPIKNSTDGTSTVMHVDFTKASDILHVAEKVGMPEVFIHLGWAEMGQPESDVHLHANVLAGETLIRTLYEVGLQKFIFVGSANEYGSRKGLLFEHMPPLGRLTKYAKVKIEVGEFGLRQADKHGQAFIRIRLFYVYGPGQRSSSLVNTLFRCRLAGSPVDLGPCEQFRDYTYVEDVVNGIVRLTEVGHSVVVNLGSGYAIKLKEFVQLFWRRLGGSPDRLNFGALPMPPDET